MGAGPDRTPTQNHRKQVPDTALSGCGSSIEKQTPVWYAPGIWAIPSEEKHVLILLVRMLVPCRQVKQRVADALGVLSSQTTTRMTCIAGLNEGEGGEEEWPCEM